MATSDASQASGSFRYCARDFTAGELAEIRLLIASGQCPGRAVLAREVCLRLNWYKPDGGLKEVSCSVALLRMQRDGLLELPPPARARPPRYVPSFTSASDPGPVLEGSRSDLGPLQLVRVVGGTAASRLWNEVIARHHYLGYHPLPVAQLRYLVYASERLVAALGFGAAAWRVLDRDDFIGWDDAQRVARLHLVVNNARFIILPSIKVRFLASSLLAQVARQLPRDWESAYGYRPLLLESFVECDRFTGTAYRAANWIFVGETTGRGKLDRDGKTPKVFKSLWLYALDRRFRRLLCAPLSPSPARGGP